MQWIVIGFLFITNIAYTQVFQVGVHGGYNSTHFNIQGTSYTDLENERLWSGGQNYGISITVLTSTGYYQKTQHGIKLELNRSLFVQKISIYPESSDPSLNWKGKYEAVFNDVAILYTQNPSHHQGVFIEGGPMFSTVIRNYNSVISNNTEYDIELQQTTYQYLHVSLLFRAGLYYNVNKKLAWSCSAQIGKNITPLTVNREFGRYWGGLNFSIIYKI